MDILDSFGSGESFVVRHKSSIYRMMESELDLDLEKRGEPPFLLPFTFG